VHKDLILGLAGGALSLIMLQVLVTLATWLG
jgi:hypothetical protein